MEMLFGNTRILAIKGDVTDQETDAIVNAANSTLLGGGGVDGAIHKRGGPAILEECMRIRDKQWPDGLPAGKAVATAGGNLKARFVVHTVGPMWHGGLHGEAETLAECYRSCLAVAREMKLTSISFPSISTGAYGFPIEKAAPIALSTVKEVLAQLRASGAGDEVPLKEVRFVLFSDRDLEFYTSQMGNSPQ